MTLLVSSMWRNFRPFPSILLNFPPHTVELYSVIIHTYREIRQNLSNSPPPPTFVVFYCIVYNTVQPVYCLAGFCCKKHTTVFGIYCRVSAYAICGEPRQDYPATASVCVTPMPRNTADWATILYASRAVRGKYCFPVPWRDGKLVKFVNKSRNLQTFKDIFPSSY